MFKGEISLNKVQINQPCSTAWESMAGDDRSRFCSECDKIVYNLSAMTRREAEALVREADGKLCARLVRDTNGSIVTVSEPIGLNLVKLRASKWAGAVVATMLSFSNQVNGQTPIQRNEPQMVHSEQPTKKGSTTSPQHGKSNLKGTIFDATRAVIADAEIFLTNLKTGEEFWTKTSDDGGFQFNSLENGLYKIKVQSQGFTTFQRKWLPIQATGELRMHITLQVGELGGVAIVGQPSIYEKFQDRVMEPFRFVKNILKKII
jgi:hypothetical protein